MKDSQKRWKPGRTKRRGLSESYVRNAASICLRPGSSISVSRSHSRSNELSDGVKGVSGVQASSGESNETSRARKGISNSNPLFRASYESRKSMGKNDEYCAKNILRFQQKLKHDLLHLGIDSMRKTLNSQLDMIDTARRFSTSISPFLLKSEKVMYELRKCKSLKPGRTGACNRTSSMCRSLNSCSSSVIRSRNVKDDESLKSQPDSEFDALKNMLSTDANAIDKSKNQSTSREDVLDSKRWRGSEQLETSLGEYETLSPDSKVSELSSCAFSCFASAFNDPEAFILGIRGDIVDGFENDSGKDYEHVEAVEFSSRNNGDPAESESDHGALLEEGGQPSSAVEVFSREATPSECISEDPDSSNISALVPPKSPENLKITNHHSPDSAMESFDGKSSSVEFFDSTGLRLQLQSRNFECGETYSETSILDLSHDSRKVKRWIRDGESRSFFYLVDVLHEAGFCDTNSYINFKMWHSLECPISPLVFDSLEKKYSKQTSWPKPERQLLFDLINSHLLGIFYPIINLPPGTLSVRRRFRGSFRLDEVVDELWMKLIRQEKEKSKAMELWLELELEEGVDIICGELETSLFDELAMEFLLVC